MRELFYSQPCTMEETFELLLKYGRDACVTAGGTDVVVNLRSKRISPKAIIQLRKVRELDENIQWSDQAIEIGALVTLSQLAEHTRIKRTLPALAQAANCVGSKQIRNRATLAGNICNASPAADTAPPLLVYNASVRLVSSRGERILPLDEFFKGPRKTTLFQGEILKSIVLPTPQADSASVYLRLSRRAGVDLSSMGTAVLAIATGEVRIALGAMGPVPLRAHAVEKLLAGKAEDEQAVENALNEMVKETSPITDIRASKEYRLEMAKVYTRRAIQEALNQLKNNQRSFQ